MRRTSIVHCAVSALIAVGVPVVVHTINGMFGFEFVVLGAVLGFAYWYWGPLAL